MLAALSALALVSGALHIASDYRGSQARFLWKPLTTATLVVIALAAPAPVTPAYRALVVVGLVFSLAGIVSQLRLTLLLEVLPELVAVARISSPCWMTAVATTAT